MMTHKLGSMKIAPWLAFLPRAIDLPSSKAHRGHAIAQCTQLAHLTQSGTHSSLA